MSYYSKGLLAQFFTEFRPITAIIMYSAPQETLLLQSADELSALARLLREGPASLRLLSGHSGVYTAGLAAAAASGEPLAVIDGAVRFNSYTLSAIASLLRIPPAILLRRTYVTRSFTAFQTEAAVTIKLPAFLAASQCRIVVVLGLLDTYYDEQVKPAECAKSLGRVVAALRAIVAGGTDVLVTDAGVANPPPGKEGLFPSLRNAAGVVLTLEQREGRLQCTQQRRLLSWDATTTPSH
jgi:hypothetical protein